MRRKLVKLIRFLSQNSIWIRIWFFYCIRYLSGNVIFGYLCTLKVGSRNVMIEWIKWKVWKLCAIFSKNKLQIILPWPCLFFSEILHYFSLNVPCSNPFLCLIQALHPIEFPACYFGNCYLPLQTYLRAQVNNMQYSSFLGVDLV